MNQAEVDQNHQEFSSHQVARKRGGRGIMTIAQSLAKRIPLAVLLAILIILFTMAWAPGVSNASGDSGSYQTDSKVHFDGDACEV